MNPATIIKQAQAEGVTLALSPAGNIKATGEQTAVTRWLPLIREHKPGILAVLQDAVNDPLPDPAVEARRQRVLAILAERPGIRYAVLMDNPDTESVILALAIRGAMKDGSIVTCALRIPREKFDPFRLVDLIGRHGATVH